MRNENTSVKAKNKGAKPRNNKNTPKPPKKITESYLHNSGLAYLQRFTASTAHFRTVMDRKIDRSCRYHTEQSRDDCAQLLNALVTKFIELGLLDDKGYARGMARSLRLRGLSSKSIYYKLMQKGLSSDLIKSSIDDIDEENNSDDLSAALRLAKRKKIGPFCTNNEKNEQRQLGQLARAGYSYDISMQILEMSEDDAIQHLNSSF